jgi:hypothetical protein
MSTLVTDAEITEDRRLRIDMEAPEDLPLGRAMVEIKIIPFVSRTSMAEKSIMDFYGIFKGEKAFGGDGVEVQRGLRDEW